MSTPATKLPPVRPAEPPAPDPRLISYVDNTPDTLTLIARAIRSLFKP